MASVSKGIWENSARPQADFATAVRLCGVVKVPRGQLLHAGGSKIQDPGLAVQVAACPYPDVLSEVLALVAEGEVLEQLCERPSVLGRHCEAGPCGAIAVF